jgi:hypothetical protein
MLPNARLNRSAGNLMQAGKHCYVGAVPCGTVKQTENGSVYLTASVYGVDRSVE